MAGPSDKGADGRRPQPLILDIKAVDVTNTASEDKDAPATGAPSDAKNSEVKNASGATAAPEAKVLPETKPSPAAEPSASPPPSPKTEPERPRVRIGAAIAGGVAGLAAGILAALLLSHVRGDEERNVETARRLAAIESGQQGVAAARRAADDATQQIKALETRLARAEAAATAAAARPAGDPELGRRIATLDESSREMNVALVEIRRRLDEMATVLTAARAASASPGEIASLAQRLAAIEQAAAALQARAAAAPPRDRDPAARFALTVLSLRPVVESGAPYAAELAAVKSLAKEPARLAPLDVFASTGLPSPALLARELAAVQAPARVAAPPDPEPTGFTDRIFASLSKLVRVRPVDSAPSAAETGRNRIQTLAASGSLAQAAEEAAKLPEAQRTPLDPWLTRVRARETALSVLRELSTNAATELAGAP